MKRKRDKRDEDTGAEHGARAGGEPPEEPPVPAGHDQQAEDEDTDRLVRRFQGGDDDAFATIYVRYFERLHGYLKLLVRDHHEAEDLAQTVFTNAFQALPRYELRGEPFRAWLFRIARNRGLDELKKLGRTEVVDPETLSNLPAEPEPELEGDLGLRLPNWINDRELTMFVERLPLSQRQVLFLHYVLGFEVADIAATLGRTPADVRTLHHRAIAFLRKRLSAVGRGPDRPDRPTPMRAWPKAAYVLQKRRFSL